jgi:hypothetical protein
MEEGQETVEIDDDLINEARKRSVRRRELIKEGMSDELLKEDASVRTHLSAHVDNITNKTVRKKVVRRRITEHKD